MEDKVHYPFNHAYQRKLAAYCIEEAFPLIENEIVRPGYFEDPYIESIISRASAYFKKVKHPPTLRILYDVFRQESDPDEWESYQHTFQSLRLKISEADKKYVLASATDFGRVQNYKVSLKECIDSLQRGDIASLDRTMERALGYGKNVMDNLGMRYFSGLQKRLNTRTASPDVLRTFIPGLDRSLEDQGYGRGELHLIAALPSTGKSFALEHMAKAAILQRKRTVFYTLEMSEERVAARLDASFSGVRMSELRMQKDRVWNKVGRAGKKFGDILVIKEYPAGQCSIGTLRTNLYNLKMEGFVPEVLILDYINLISPSQRNVRHRELGQVYIDLRGLIQQLKMWGITAAQSNRGGYDSTLLTMKNLAETFEGAMHCLHGSTCIDVPRNLQTHPKGVQIRHLVGKKFYAYSWSESQQQFVLKKVHKVIQTGKSVPVYKMVWYDGYTRKYGQLIGTFEHKVMLRTGKYRQLGHLQPGDSLKVFRRLYDNYFKPYVSLRISPQTLVAEHRFVYKQLHPDLPHSWDVHHLDGNIYNNSLSNLEPIPHDTHSGLHNADKEVSEETRRRLGIVGRRKRLSDRHKAILSARWTGDSNPQSRVSREERKAMGNHKVVSVEFHGYEDVYDMEVEGTHNFVANEIVVHNSDTVITLNRTDEEAEKERLRIFIAKDRNGIDRRIVKIHTNYGKGAFFKAAPPPVNGQKDEDDD